MADTGNGATLTRAGVSVDIVSMQLGNRTIETLDVSLLGETTGYIQEIAADLADSGNIVVEYLFDTAGGTAELPKPGGAAVSTTVTFPISATGNTVAALLTGGTIITDVKPPDLANNELQTATITLKFDGGQGGTAIAFSGET